MTVAQLGWPGYRTRGRARLRDQGCPENPRNVVSIRGDSDDLGVNRALHHHPSVVAAWATVHPEGLIPLAQDLKAFKGTRGSA